MDFTPEINVFFVLFNRCLPIFSTTSPKQHRKYFNIQCKIQLDLPVLDVLLLGPRENQEVLDIQRVLRDVEVGVGADWGHADCHSSF